MTERAALLVGASPERMGWDRRGLQNTKRRQDEEEEKEKAKFAWEGRGMDGGGVVRAAQGQFYQLAHLQHWPLSSQFLGTLKRAQLVGKEPR